jgi:hypothetical protein
LECDIIKIQHRVNDITSLAGIPTNIGVEVDIHAYGSKLVTVHDAFEDGLNFENWLDHCGDRFIIFNVKEEGIEDKVLELIKIKKLKNYFFLDLSFPVIRKMIKNKERKIAIRVSEYEPVEIAEKMKDDVDWIWLDCFRGFPLSKEETYKINSTGLKVCLVSPELHGFPRTKDEIIFFKKKIQDYKLNVKAVCTKFPNLW